MYPSSRLKLNAVFFALAWSLRSLARVDLANPCSMLWWW
jgi:hypothetical protein